MLGIDNFTAIINPPNACILAIGGIRDIPVVKDGAVVPGKRMTITLSCDHRIVDGATGARFVATVKQYLEEPANDVALTSEVERRSSKVVDRQRSSDVSLRRPAPTTSDIRHSTSDIRHP